MGPNQTGEFVSRIIEAFTLPIVRNAIRTARRDGITDPESIRKHVMKWAMEGSPLTIDPSVEYKREVMIAQVQRILQEYLSLLPKGQEEMVPTWKPIVEAECRRPTMASDRWIELANGEKWAFPVPSVDVGTLFEVIGGGDGRSILVGCVSLESAINSKDSAAISKAMFDLGSILLRKNYHLDSVECRRLMPISLEDEMVVEGYLWDNPIDPGLASLTKEERVTRMQELGAEMAGRSIAISNSLMELIKPVFAAYSLLSKNQGDDWK